MTPLIARLTYWLLTPALLLAIWSEFEIAWPFWTWLAFSAVILAMWLAVDKPWRPRRRIRL